MDFDKSLNTIDLEVKRSQLTQALHWKTRELENAADADINAIQQEIKDIKQELKELDDYRWILKKYQ